MEEKSYLEERYEDFLSEINEYESNNDVKMKILTQHKSHIMCVFSSSSSSETEIEEDIDWSDFDPARYHENFENIAGVNIFSDDPQSVADVTSLFIGNDLFEKIVLETNSYHRANSHKYKNYAHGLKWIDVTISEIKKVFALTIIMGLVRKNNLQSYWFKHSLIATPLFSKTMSRDLVNNEISFCKFLLVSIFLITQTSKHKTGQCAENYNYFLNKFRSVYEPEQNLSFDQNIISWKGRLQFRVYNPKKMIKHSILNTIVCESKTGYICNLLLFCKKKYEFGEHYRD